MKKIIVLLFSLVLVLGIANIALAATDEEPVKVEAEIEDVREEPVEEETEAVEDEVIIEEPEAVEEPSCAHTEGAWSYDLIEHDDGSTTFYRWCECGAYEELEEQTFYDLGGQYENCEKGRHYWIDVRHCKECGYSELDEMIKNGDFQ